jgi:hypothetical protein
MADQRDQPDPVYPANLIYRGFKDKHTGQNGHPVPLYQVPDPRGGTMTITKEEYFLEVLKRKVQARHVQKDS